MVKQKDGIKISLLMWSGVQVKNKKRGGKKKNDINLVWSWNIFRSFY